jgi:hypothetical protein
LERRIAYPPDAGKVRPAVLSGRAPRHLTKGWIRNRDATKSWIRNRQKWIALTRTVRCAAIVLRPPISGCTNAIAYASRDRRHKSARTTSSAHLIVMGEPLTVILTLACASELQQL